MTIEAWSGTSRWIEGRSRLSRGSVERQTSQVHPIIGTPADVPVPRNVTRPCRTLTGSGDDDARGLRSRSLLARFDVTEAQFVEDLFEQLPLFRCQVAARLLFEEGENVDHLLRRRKVGGYGLSGDRIGNVPEMHGRRVGK